MTDKQMDIYCGSYYRYMKATFIPILLSQSRLDQCNYTTLSHILLLSIEIWEIEKFQNYNNLMWHVGNILLRVMLLRFALLVVNSYKYSLKEYQKPEWLFPKALTWML